jgi:UDP-2-acetamido-3-amino-2,3-dideoxy-glucuronate N-acetyltransferase
MSPETSPASFFAHPTAIIDPASRVGEGSKIWHFSHVMANSVVGRKCNLGQNVVVSPGCHVGDGCKIQNNVSIYTGVTLEEGVFCGPSMVFTNVINPRAFIERKSEYKATLVRKGASIGANATIVCGTTLGAYCFVGAGAVVTRDVPDFALVYGSPARVRGWVCYCGVQLALAVDDGSEHGRCGDCSRRRSR